MEHYNYQDCDEIGCDFSIRGKVVVVSETVLPQKDIGQLFFCTGGSGAEPNPADGAVTLVSHSTGEYYHFQREDVIGSMVPEYLPDDARLQLSQIRPSGAADISTHEPLYSGYSFLLDGRYAAGVWLCSPEEVKDYVEMQSPYQHRVLICDRDDYAVMEVVNGQVVFPSLEDMEKFLQEQKSNGGMTMT